MGKNKKKQVCKYGAKCYRKNAKHLEEFSHPDEENSDDSDQDLEPKTKKAKTSTEVQQKAAETVVDSDDNENESEEEEEKSKPAAASAAAAAEDEKSPDSDQEDDEDATPPASPKDIRENIKSKFLVEMPEDFYSFWELVKSMNPKDPCNAFKSSLGLQLVGPFDILAGKTKAKNSRGKRPCYLRHWRYYFDPPEFSTVLRAVDKSCFHLGYFRDDPKELPVFVASNTATENGNIGARGENIFAAVCWYIDEQIKKDKSKKDDLTKVKTKIQGAAKKGDYPLELKTKSMKARDKKVVTKSFHGAGIVVPIDEQEIGYRELPETPADLKKILKRIADSKTQEERDKNFDPLMEIIMLVQFANDECDYGEGLELGIDLFSYGGDVFNSTILNLMPLAYQLLGRLEFKQITEAHLKSRQRSDTLSELD